jgi:FAD/FMN-containing dehydrogenase
MDPDQTTALLHRLRRLLGAAHVLTGDDAAPYGVDWTGTRRSRPLAVLRPASSSEVAAALGIAREARAPVVPLAGNTGLTGAGQAEGALVVSLERMAAIREIREAERLAVVEAGVVVQSLQDAAEAVGLAFPLAFGARGTARIGGVLSTNAGGANALRHGSARALCLGIEVALTDGRVLDLMSTLRKDNSGYDLRDLFIGAEGTLGLVTAAVLRLVPQPRARATGMVAAPSLEAALALLNRLQDETSGQVEAFEYMPRAYVEAHLAQVPGARAPFAEAHEVNLLVEVGTTAARDAEPGPDGAVPVVERLEGFLGAMIEAGLVLDAVVARSEAQRREMWARREAAAELAFGAGPVADHDVAVPLAAVPTFLERADAAVAGIEPEAHSVNVAHLGDGNVHYTVRMPRADPALKERITEAVEEVVASLGGTFSAEHGVGTHKLASMARRKDPVALDVMRAVKAALDPYGIMNPGKVLPPRN